MPARKIVAREVPAMEPLPKLEKADLAEFGCDISYISHESIRPETLVGEEVVRLNMPQLAPAIWGTFERLRAVYEGGGFVLHPMHVRAMLVESAQSHHIELPTQVAGALLQFFSTRVNRTFFAHQSLMWLADTDFKVHLYGHGWDMHPTLRRFARGPVENDAARLAIYRASKINLQMHPDGVVQDRLLEGLSVGGFFLLRYCAADVMERMLPPIWKFCSELQINSNDDLKQSASSGIWRLLNYLGKTFDVDVFQAWPNIVGMLRDAADADFARSAAALWPEYSAVAYSSRDELIGLASRYLYNVPERMEIAENMRVRVAQRFAHVHLNRNLLTNLTPRRTEVAA